MNLDKNAINTDKLY